MYFLACGLALKLALPSGNVWGEALEGNQLLVLCGRVSLSNCVPPQWWEQELATLNWWLCPGHRAESLSLVFQTAGALWRPAELSMLPGIGVLNPPLLAGLHSWHSFPSSVTQKAESQQQWWFYVHLNGPVSCVGYCLTSEWQQDWVFPVVGVYEAKMNPIMVI